MNFELFHFIRPFWLTALPCVFLVWWLVRRYTEVKTSGSNLIEPHLLEALLMQGAGNQWFRAVDGVALSLVLVSLAAAGPTWNQQPSPWFSETAPLVIAVEVSDSMRSNDSQPTRLDRARFKALDLMDMRTGARTALIAYAGSAHLVMPPTKDVQVIKPFLEGLDPGVMPVKGAHARQILPMAMEILEDQSARSSIVILTDGFEQEDIAALAEFTATENAPSVFALIFGTEKGGVALMPDGSPIMSEDGGRLDTSIDKVLLSQIEKQTGITLIYASTGNSDLNSLLSAVASQLLEADDPDAIWQDQGWWLIWPALLLTLLWFRQGWTMTW